MSSPGPEDLIKLFQRLLKKGTAYIAQLGCPYPDQCANDALTEYIFDRKFRGQDRARISGELIELNFPGARNQLKVLNDLAMKEVKGKWSHCRDCKHRNRFCSIVEDFNNSDDDGWRASEHVLIDPKTPEDIYELKEVLDMLAASANERERGEIVGIAVGHSTEEIAEQSEDSPQNVRKRRSRFRERFKHLFGTSIFGRWNR